jgi:hypothetical protein
MKVIYLFSITLISTVVLSGCYKDVTKPPGDCDVIVSYSMDIKPIIDASCITQIGTTIACHDNWIVSYSGVEYRINEIEYECLAAKTMPQIPNDQGIDSLTNDELKSIRCWIEQGYPDN